MRRRIGWCQDFTGASRHVMVDAEAAGLRPARRRRNGGGTPVETTTITITSAGVSPQSIIVNAGAKVMFVNNDSRAHEPSSNPHPSHTQCPELNIGSLAAGQSRESAPMVGGRTCGFHDHLTTRTRRCRGASRRDSAGR